jgi:hypothetical protein
MLRFIIADDHPVVLKGLKEAAASWSRLRARTTWVRITETGNSTGLPVLNEIDEISISRSLGEVHKRLLLGHQLY